MPSEKPLCFLHDEVPVEWNKWRDDHPQEIPDLTQQNLRGLNLERANLAGCDLSDADLSHSNLRNANLGAWYVSGPEEGDPWFWRSCCLDGANLRNADLTQALFIASCFKTDFSEAICNYTRFVNIANLQHALGLSKIVVTASDSICSIGLDTIFQSEGKLPKQFLKRCGYPPGVQDRVFGTNAFDPHSVIPINDRFSSVFISCVSEDVNFAKRLIVGLKGNRIKNWLYTFGILGGSNPQDAIDTAIERHDRLILVVSKRMLIGPRYTRFASDNVRKEILRAREKEQKLRKKNAKLPGVIFPIMLDDAFVESDNMEIKLLRQDAQAVGFNERSLGSFKKDVDQLVKGLNLNEVKRAVGIRSRAK